MSTVYAKNLNTTTELKNVLRRIIRQIDLQKCHKEFPENNHNFHVMNIIVIITIMLNFFNHF